MKWEKGVVYKISPKSKKHIEYIQFYEKDGLEIKYVEGYSSGWVTVTGDEMESEGLDLDEMIGDSNSDGLNVYGHFSTEDHFFSDGVSDDIVFPKTLSKGDRDKLENIFFEEGTDGLENMGWEQVDSELLFFGKLNINKL